MDPIYIQARWMIRQDMPEVLRMDEECFRFPWREEDFYATLRQRNCIGMVAEQGQDLFGYMVYELHESHLHLVRLAVDVSCWRRRVGSQLIDKIKSKLRSQRRDRISVVIRETNLAGQLFLRAQGFKGIGVMRECFEDSGEDGYQMVFCCTEED